MDIQKICISKINPAPYNPRKDLRPGDKEYERLARSIDEFGYVQLLVWNERTGNLVGGHQGLKILVERGHDKANVCVVNLTDERERALNIALNKVSGEWDNDLLTELLAELGELDFDLSLTGFDEAELDAMLKGVNFEMSNLGEQGDLSMFETKRSKTVSCPGCGEEFVI